MVTARAPTLDVHDDVLAWHLCGDVDDRLDLVDGAGLEHHVTEADAVEFLDQLDCVLEIRDARTDDDTVDRGTGLTGLLHQPLSAHLQLPQIGVQEQRIELHGTARLEQLGEFGDAVFEYLLGDLTAAGQLGPVARVGRRGDDLGVDGRRGHTGEQHRRTPGQPGELGGQLHRTVGQLHGRRRIARPRRRHLGCGTDGEQVALPSAGGRGNDSYAETPDHRGGQACHGVGGSQVDDPLRAGLVEPLDLGHPVDGANEDRLGHLVCHRGVDAALLGPALDYLDAVGQPRSMEADLDLHTVEFGANTAPPRSLFLRSASSRSVILLQ